MLTWWTAKGEQVEVLLTLRRDGLAHAAQNSENGEAFELIRKRFEEGGVILWDGPLNSLSFNINDGQQKGGQGTRYFLRDALIESRPARSNTSTE